MAEITGFWQSNLRDLLAELGEERTSEILSAFECPLNPDVQSFLREKAILFSKHGYASTYLVFASYQGSVVLIGYCQKVRRQKNMNIKELRILRGLSQKELADKMGISAQQLNSYESGQRNPGNKILPALTDALGFSTAYIRGDAQRLAVYNWETGRTEALPIMAETVIDDYGIFYLVEHPEVGMMAVIQSEGVQFTLARWRDNQPMTVDEIGGARWVDRHGDDVIMYKGLPRGLVGGEFGSKRDRVI